MKNMIKFFFADFKYKLFKSKKIPLIILVITLFYGIFLYANLYNYHEISERLEIDQNRGYYLRIPITEPEKNAQYFSNFVPTKWYGPSKTDSLAGFMFMPDRMENQSAVNVTGLFFIFSTIVIVIMSTYEITEMREKGLLKNILASPLKKKGVLGAKMILGFVVCFLIFFINVSLALLLIKFHKMPLTALLVKQVIAFNFLFCLFLINIYIITLMITVMEKNSGYAMVKSIVALIIVIFVLPAVSISISKTLLKMTFRSDVIIIYDYLVRPIDLFGTFKELVSDFLYLGYAKAKYSSSNINWIKNIAANGKFDMWKLIIINWHKIITMSIWGLISYSIAKRRFEKSDVL